MYIVEKTRSRDLNGNNLPINENSNWERVCTTSDKNVAFETRVDLMACASYHYYRIREQ